MFKQGLLFSILLRKLRLRQVIPKSQVSQRGSCHMSLGSLAPESAYSNLLLYSMLGFTVPGKFPNLWSHGFIHLSSLPTHMTGDRLTAVTLKLTGMTRKLRFHQPAAKKNLEAPLLRTVVTSRPSLSWLPLLLLHSLRLQPEPPDFRTPGKQRGSSCRGTRVPPEISPIPTR